MLTRQLIVFAVAGLAACGGPNPHEGPDSGVPDGGDPQDCGTLSACGGRCVDLASDRSNCGTCGHSCQGGACQAGACQAVLLAAGLNTPSRLTLNDGHLYWSEFSDPAVRRVPLDGGAIQTLATGMSAASGIAADDTHVYWVNRHSGLWQAPLDGGTPVLLASDGPSNSVVRLGDRLYWGSASDRRMKSIGVDGAGLEESAVGILPTDIAPEGEALYFGSQRYFGAEDWSAGVHRMASDGGVEPLAPANTVLRIAVASGHLTWVDGNLGSGRFLDAGVYAMSPGGQPLLVAALGSQEFPSGEATGVAGGLAADARSLYWTDMDGGRVMRAPWDGGAPEVVAAGQVNAVGLVIDSTRIYWSTFGPFGEDAGTIRMIAK